MTATHKRPTRDLHTPPKDAMWVARGMKRYFCVSRPCKRAKPHNARVPHASLGLGAAPNANPNAKMMAHL